MREKMKKNSDRLHHFVIKCNKILSNKKKTNKYGRCVFVLYLYILVWLVGWLVVQRFRSPLPKSFGGINQYCFVFVFFSVCFVFSSSYFCSRNGNTAQSQSIVTLSRWYVSIPLLVRDTFNLCSRISDENRFCIFFFFAFAVAPLD